MHGKFIKRFLGILNRFIVMAKFTSRIQSANIGHERRIIAPIFYPSSREIFTKQRVYRAVDAFYKINNHRTDRLNNVSDDDYF